MVFCLVQILSQVKNGIKFQNRGCLYYYELSPHGMSPLHHQKDNQALINAL